MASTTTATLWRLAITTEAPLTRPEALATGLRRHLAVAPIRAAIAQIGERQQAYVALDGCPGCAHSRCVEGCHVEALRRTLRATSGANIAITLVRSGLSPRPYIRRYGLRLMPGFKGVARELNGSVLHHWPEARLTMNWTGTVKEQAMFTASLHLGEAGPDPRAAFAELGWQALQRRLLPGEKANAHLAGELGMFKVFNGPTAWGGEPWLLLPTAERNVRPARVEGEVAAVDVEVARAKLITAGAYLVGPGAGKAAQEGAEDGEAAQEGAENAMVVRARRARLADHLGPIVAGEAIFSKRGELASVAAIAVPEERVPGVSKPAAASQPPRPESIWPRGPGTGKGGLWPAALAAFFAAILAPESSYHNSESPGLTYRRVLDALGERRAEHTRALIVWLDQAGLLQPPLDPALPWEEARLLTTLVPTEIAEHLSRTPHPTGEDLELANKQGLNKKQGLT